MADLTRDEKERLVDFSHEYFQLVELDLLRWPAPTLLKKPQAQQWLYEMLFENVKYAPPLRYQLRILKRLIKTIEGAIDDPEEDVGCSVS
ncbi:hypothetical protein EJ06DRAFT_529765 [Trichodelitschia bisporula]|uniref:Uncharacterized protein n=1 Tax=Trichodelitschia bisporula TaxID=703511 RepID=A0A6G1HY14_9PEZI|nr:hypothetical protein EJ06DRAFT_529765 [Trichodelitschia bisporula]